MTSTAILQRHKTLDQGEQTKMGVLTKAAGPPKLELHPSTWACSHRGIPDRILDLWPCSILPIARVYTKEVCNKEGFKKQGSVDTAEIQTPLVANPKTKP